MHSFSELTYINSSSIQSSHGNFETIPQLPYQIRGWNFTVFKYNSSSGLGVPSNLQTLKKKIEYFEKILQGNSFFNEFCHFKPFSFKNFENTFLLHQV